MALISFQPEREAHLLPLSVGIQRVLGWNVNDTNAFSAESLERATTWHVVGLAGDPELGHAMSPGEGDDQAASPLGVMTSTVIRFHVVADVPSISDYTLVPTHPQSDAPHVLTAGGLHFES